LNESKNEDDASDPADTESGASAADSLADAGEYDVNERRLYPEDQAKVDAFLKRGVNAVERKPFRPLLLMMLLVVVVTAFSFLSQGIAQWAGIY
tara:strand:+ start:2230 stop:2511 length:282 start_codon:yes stop_codon:yes gene_type:complete